MINKVAEFKDRLIKAMSDRDVRAVQVTAMTGISEATISQYRSGYAKPKADKLQTLADALDVNPAWLMGLDVPMDNVVKIQSFDDPNHYELTWAERGGGKHELILSEKEEKLIRRYRTADDQTKEMVERILRYPPKSLSFAARRKTKPSTKLIVRRKEKV